MSRAATNPGTDPVTDLHEERILVLAPLGRDAPLLCGALTQVGLRCLVSTPTDLQAQLLLGVGVLLLTEEALTPATIATVEKTVETQPEWSDLPLVLLVNESWRGLKTSSFASTATVLERPTRIPTLITVVRMALTARRRQYQVRDLLRQQEDINARLETRVNERTADLKKAHAQTEAERYRATTILESISDAFTALDKDYRFTYLNQRGEELVREVANKSIGDLLGKSMWEAFPGSENSAFGNAYRTALEKHVSVQLEQFFAPLETWFEIHVYPYEQGLSVFFQNITKRKKAELEVRESNQRFEKAFRVGPVAASITTLDEGRFIDVNESFKKLTGYTGEEVLGETDRALTMWASVEDQAKMTAAMQGSGSYHDLELHIRTKEGDTRSILASAEVIMVENTPCLLNMFYDITERKQTEDEMLQAINEVMQDAAWFSRSLVEKLAQVRAKRAGNHRDTGEVAELTKREKQVLVQMARGRGNAAIAADLGLAEQTVRNYITNLYEKIGVHSRTEAVVWARERGFASF